MPNYAVVDSNDVVQNIIVWDEVSQWQPPEGHSLVKADDVACNIGWKHNNGVFSDPNPPEEVIVKPNPEQ